MCLAIPMKLIEILDNNVGRMELDGIQSRVDLSFIENPVVGQYFIVHVGYAIERLDEEEAQKQISMFQEISRLSN